MLSMGKATGAFGCGLTGLGLAALMALALPAARVEASNAPNWGKQPPHAPVPAPTNLRWNLMTLGSGSLVWDYTYNPDIRFKLYRRSVNGGSWQLIAQSQAYVGSWFIQRSGDAALSTWEYRVVAVDGSYASQPSNAVQIIWPIY